MKMLSFDTTKRTQVVDITKELIEQSRIWRKSGIINVYCPHTTAGLTIQENYDLSVKDDILLTLERLVPQNFGYRHSENNADAHIKSVLCGVSITVPVSNGHLLLGRWQGVFLLELDGPRKRQVYLTFIEGE